MESKQSNTPTRRERKGFWSAVDTLILLLILAAVAGIVMRIVITVRNDSPEGEVYRVYFEVHETHRDVLDEVRGFDAVYLCENDMRLGAIAAKVVDDATGKTAAALTPSYIEGTETATATGCMVCRGPDHSAEGLLVEGTGRYLTCGSVVQIRTDRVILTVTITDIEADS